MPTIPSNRQITAQLEVGRPDGTTWEDVTEYLAEANVDLGDIDQVGTGNLGGDSVVRTLDFTLHNDRTSTTGDSLHPLDKTSSFNQVDNVWTPLLWPLREVVLRVTIKNYADNSTETYDLFAGYLGDSIQSSDDGHSITCQARDYSKLIQDTYVDEVREYGSEAGVDIETVIQNVLNDNMGTDAPTVYTPTSPNFVIKPYELDYKSVWDAIQELASTIGWFLGYKYNATADEWRLTFEPPPRTKGTGDYSLTAEDDIYTADLDISDSDIRNIIQIEHRNEDTGEIETSVKADQDSIDEFRERRMTIGVQDAPHIDTLAEGEDLADMVLSDLKDLSSTTRINMPLFPQADLYTGFDVNDPRLASDNQFYAVETLRHSLRYGSSPQFRTEVTAGGKVIGSKHKWLRMETRPGAGKPIEGPDIINPNYERVVAANDTPLRRKRLADYICDGSADQVQINSAISELQTGAGGRVLLLEGTYEIDDSIELESDIALTGQGKSTIIKLADNTDTDGLNLIKNKHTSSGNDNIEVSNLKVDGNTNNNNNDQDGIHFESSSGTSENLLVSKVLVVDCNNHGIVAGTNTVNFKALDCTSNFNYFGFVITSDSSVINCTMKDNIAAIGGSNLDNVIINSNLIADNAIGINLKTVDDSVITGNRIRNHPQDGIRISDSSGSVMVENNLADNNNNGILIWDNADEINIKNNKFRNNTYYGIYIETSDCDRTLVSNNDCYVNGTAGIRDDGTDTSFGAGNRVSNGRWTTEADG